MRALLLCLSLLLAMTASMAAPSLVQQVSDKVIMVHDDSGQWGGMTSGITHQNASSYEAKKILDLSDVPAETWNAVNSVRLSVYMMVRDYSFVSAPPANGLDEVFQISVNGNTHEYPTSGGAPVYKESSAPTIAWYDVAIAKAELNRGVNEIVLRKAPGKPGQPEAKSDDYLYLGIDNSVKRGNSAVNLDGTTWTQEKLTVPGGNGEYMIRLYLLTGASQLRAVWQPGEQSPLDDPARVLLYAGGRGLGMAAGALVVAPGRSARVEWAPGSIDALEALRIDLQAQGTPELLWLDAAGVPVKEPGIVGLTAELPANRTFQPSGLLIKATQAPVRLQSVTLNASRAYHPETPKINMAPIVSVLRNQPAARRPACRPEGDQLTLIAGHTQATFQKGPSLRLRSLKNLITGTEMLRHPDQVALFVIETGGKRLVGSRDFEIKALRPSSVGFTCDLQSAQPALQAVLDVKATSEGLRMALEIVNTGTGPVEFKVAFPHVSGLAVSPDPADDYYYYPFGGGIIAPVAAIIRHGYGDHEALYQVMDIFSPQLGSGVYVRADDAEGWHKILAMRKHLPGQAAINESRTWVDMRVREEYRWNNSLDEEVEGTSISYEYLRRTRAPQAQAAPADPTDAATLQKTASFAPAPAVIAAHPGDWHVAMERYADWAHEQWKFRPYPSKLHDVRNMMAAGWGQGFLFRDGKYRTDIIRPDTDCVELMSWWEWSPLGPFMTPFDKLDQLMTPEQIKRWQPYFVTDPVTGQQMWNNQPGDYKGYNERIGGLPAFQKAVQTYKDMGSLVTLYTDPFRLDSNNEIGGKYGEQWGVVDRDGKKTTGYEVWNPCHNLAEVRDWVATTMGRVMRETKADGIRLDEYGHRGWACYDDTHKHTYQEPGITQWQKAVAEATRMVHEEMDKANPKSVLTTEFPAYDYFMQNLEGCITYDLTTMASPLRPLECNLQRFYFPQCKPYELDHRGADLQSRKKFWNAVESFGRYYPPIMYNILNENQETYWGKDTMPLLPTLQPFIYANRFGATGKTLIHLYNALGHTFEGPVLELEGASGGVHAFELLLGQEIPLTDRRVTLYLERDDIACVAILPRLLSFDTQKTLRIKDSKGGQVVVVNEKGENALSLDATGAAATLDMTRLPEDTKPLYIKLLRNGQLVDAVALPQQ